MKKSNNTKAPLVRKIMWKPDFLVLARLCVLILSVMNQDFTIAEDGPRALPQRLL